MPLVYRVERRDNPQKGPYATTSGIPFAANGSDQPTPNSEVRWIDRDEDRLAVSQLYSHWQDMGWSEMQPFFFGFKTLKQARRWFGGGGWPLEAERTDMVVRVYRVKRRDLLKGFDQVAFRMDQAQPVGTLSPLTLLESDDVKGYVVSRLEISETRDALRAIMSYLDERIMA